MSFRRKTLFFWKAYGRFSKTPSAPSNLAQLNQNTVVAILPNRKFHANKENQDGHEDPNDEEMDELTDLTMVKLGEAHSVFVIQPDIVGIAKPEWMKYTTTQLQLAESAALVDSIPGWKVSGKASAKTRTIADQKIFKEYQMKNLSRALAELSHTTALFVSIDRLNGLQRKYFQDETRIETVFDRYMLVLEIFRMRAQTKQAKLQVALAEIPYLKSNLKADIHSINRQGRGNHSVGGPGETPLELLMRQFRFREQKIKQRLSVLGRRRRLHRETRKRSQVPIVAVVGYTNSGKTTLIRALTGSHKLEPKDHLFATLDVTAHSALSAGNIKYLLVDTVGFLSNIPHSLIDAFSATMEDMLQADVIVHVCDVSHPDCTNQRKNVYKVLSDLNLPRNLLENMIEVQNKIDIASDPNILEIKEEPSGNSEHEHSSRQTANVKTNLNPEPILVCKVSATIGTGMKHFAECLHDRIIDITGSGNISIRVPADGDYLDWFDKYATVTEVKADGDYHFIVDLTITEAMLNKFRSTFVKYQILS